MRPRRLGIALRREPDVLHEGDGGSELLGVSCNALSGRGSRSYCQPMASEMRRSAVYPIRSDNRAWDGAVVGFNARCIAAASRTASNATAQDDQASGERKRRSTGYLECVSERSAAHCSHWP